MSKYCEIYFNGKHIGFENASMRAKAYSFINSRTKLLSAEEFYVSMAALYPDYVGLKDRHTRLFEKL